MLVKEAGYDEFLAEKLARADEDIRAGRVYTAEEVEAALDAMLKRKALELAQAEREMIAYG